MTLLFCESHDTNVFVTGHYGYPVVGKPVCDAMIFEQQELSLMTYGA